MIDDPNQPPPNDVRPTDIPEAFHKTEKLLAALLETASQAILMIDRAGRMVLANRRACACPPRLPPAPPKTQKPRGPPWGTGPPGFFGYPPGGAACPGPPGPRGR